MPIRKNSKPIETANRVSCRYFWVVRGVKVKDRGLKSRASSFSRMKSTTYVCNEAYPEEI